VILASSRGIGRAIALRLAADGFNIAINDVSQQRQDGEDVVREVEKLPGRKAAFFAAGPLKMRYGFSANCL
jgi:NAD(P)-dependent dehydrogenase (short-subunit alcohol dehydrogenase family)